MMTTRKVLNGNYHFENIVDTMDVKIKNTEVSHDHGNKRRITIWWPQTF